MAKAQRISELLRSTFDGEAWYGPSVMSVLKDISPEQVFNKIGESNSIIELVEHMTAWRNFTIKKLQGDVSFDIKTDEMNFPQSKDWNKSLEGLKESQHKLLGLLEDLPDERLVAFVEGRKYSFQVLLHGIIQHDIYHLGQIQLIKKYV